MERENVRQIKLTRSIILGGEHQEEGSVHEVSRAQAHHLVGEGSAEYLEGDEESAPTRVDRMGSPANADPQHRRMARPSPKVKEK